MNPLHFPSLELCLRLTEAGFPETENFKTNYIGNFEEVNLVCPSVMELLDCTPIDKIDIWYSYPDWRIKLKENTTSDARNETLPNALAEMWLWLSENNYLIK